MKFLAVLVVAVACASAVESALVQDDFNSPVIRSNYDISPEGAFQYAYETGNGIYSQASGVIKNPGAEYPTLAVNGGYKYTAPDGQVVEVTYEADENGFKPVGSHIPEAPPTPEAILRSLAYIAAHPAPVENAAKAAYNTFTG